MTASVEYLGELRTTAVHSLSGNKITTDAPPDNNGKGEAFSPTDLLATSLASCILTTIGIVARREGMTTIEGAKAEVLKVMYPDPRRVGEVHVKIIFPPGPFTERERRMYENTAHACPVARSLHPDLKQVLEFVWP